MAQRQLEATYRTIFEESPQPMWVLDRETMRFVAVNDAALDLYGYSRTEFLHLSLEQVVCEPSGAEPQGYRRHLCKDGSGVLVRTTQKPLDFAGARAQLALLDYPVEERKEAALELTDLQRQLTECRSGLQTANKEMETFSYSLSHDLRAPLRHIDGFSRALLDDYGDRLDAAGKEYLSRIGQAAQRMSLLIDDVLKLTRVARCELELQPVHLSVVVRVITLELKQRDPGRRVEFRIEEGVRAQADPRLTRILLDNLLQNAWKFSAGTEAAVIEFGTVQREGERVYYVRDNGVGFDMAYAGKLFTLFGRLHRADEFPGNGVGLAVAQRIVRRHGGRIWAESAPGQGATFCFTL